MAQVETGKIYKDGKLAAADPGRDLKIYSGEKFGENYSDLFLHIGEEENILYFLRHPDMFIFEANEDEVGSIITDHYDDLLVEDDILIREALMSI